MISPWNLSDSKSPQVSRTLLSILVDFNNVVVWMVSTRHLISKFSSTSTNPLATVPRAPITIGIIVTFMFHSFFQFPSKVLVLILLFTFQFYLMVNRDRKVHNSANSLFCWLLLGLIVWPRLSDPFICLILWDICWFVHILFIRMVKLQFFAHRVASSLLLILS